MKKIYTAVFGGKISFVIGALCLFSSSTFSQTVTIEGTGTASSYLYSPMYTFNAAPRSLRIAYIYSQSLLSTMPSGSVINKLQFSRNSTTGTLPAGNNVKLYLMNTSLTDWGAGALTWDVSSATLVFDGDPSTIVGSTSGYKEFILTTPFVYNGGNLALFSEYAQTAAPATTINWNYNTSTTQPGYSANQTKYTVNTTTTMPTTLASSTANHPNIKIDYSSGSACTSPPTPGTASVSPGDTVCAGAAVSFNLSGNSFGTGQTYQWESSTTLGGTYTAVSGVLTVPTFNTTAPTGTVYYRAAVTCSGNTQYSDTIALTGRSPLAAGVYTINSAVATGGTNFQSFTDAVNAITCGIAGSVVFNVVPGSGPYLEQIMIPQVPGSSATSTITFNGNGDTLRFAPVTAARHIISLNGADYVTIKRLNIISLDPTYGWGIHLTNGADNNTIDSCNIDVSAVTSTTQSNSGGIVASGSTTSVTTAGDANNNTISNNTVTGGYQGIIIIGTATGLNAADNNITNNLIRDFYANGIELTNNDGSVVSFNNIHRANRVAVTTFAGIELGAGNRNVILNANRIHDTHNSASSQTGSAYGIFLSGCDAPAGSENRITNNLIYNFNSGSGLIYGLYNSSSDGAFYYHNTIALDDASATAGTTRGFYQTTLAARIELKNNIFTIRRTGSGTKHILYFNTATTTYVSNYNDLLITPGAGNFTGNVGGTSGTDYVTLANWQAGTTQDANSVAIDPQYIDPNTGNYYPNNNALDNLGTPVGVTTDIANNPRSTTTPDMGAYEFTPIVCTNPPVPGTLSTSASPVCLGESFTISITGGTIGAGQTYQWQSSPDNTNWTDIPGETNTTLTTTQNASTYYRVVYTCGASVPSSGIQVVTPTPASGTYTINSAGGGDFTSFNAAYNFIRCGIGGPVVINVAPGSGPYNEQLIMEPIPGASATNTVTFNGNGNSIRFLSTNTNERAVIKLLGADHIIFDSLVVEALGSASGEYGFGFQLMNSADSNTIRRCVINIDTTATLTNFAGIVVNNSATSATASGSAECDGNLIDRNTVTGGYYGMTLVSSTTVFNSYNKITRNSFKDFYFYGIYVSGTFETLIDSNTITRPLRSNVSTFNGIYFTSLSTKATVSRNTITNPFGGEPNSTSEFNGIYFTGVDALSTNNRQNRVYNNLIYNLTGNGNVTGIHNSGSDNALYFHNTISIDGAAPSTTATNFSRGFYQTTNAFGIEFKNNIITVSRGGLSTKHNIYYNATGSDVVSDFNDFFIFSTTGANYIGFVNANDHLILANWQAASGDDANSVSNDPLYTDPGNGNFKPINASIDNLGTPVGVLNDILGMPRSATNPDMGAYEFAAPACTTPPTPGTATVSNTPACENSLVQLGVTGHSTGSGQTYVWQSATSVGGPYADISTALINPSFTVTATATLYYRVAITCSGNTVYSTPVLLTVTPGLPGGVYTIDNSQPPSPSNFVSFNAAKDAMACGITGPVVFEVEPNTGPYNEQVIFDSIPGASAVNTITFKGNGNTIAFSSTNTNERAVIKFNSADHITFDSLTIDATGANTYGWGVQFINNADSNVIRNCTILANSTSTSSTNYHGIVMSASHTTATTTGNTMSDFNQITNNHITGGYYGIALVGSVTVPVRSNKVVGNKIEDYYFSAVYANGNIQVLIDSNDISRPARTNSATTTYGVYFTGVSTLSRINANRIHNPFGGMPATTNDFYGIYLTSVDAVGGQENIISNNLIYDLNGTGDIYALANSGSSSVRYYHNTISIDNTANSSTTGSRGFYQTLVADGIEFRNNIISITRGGTGLKHALYFATATSVIFSDDNDLYVNGAGGANHVGYNGTNRTTLADWQASSMQDANSFSTDPMFTDPQASNYAPLNAIIDNVGTPVGITTDIYRNARSATTPDIGAIEFAVILCTEPPVAGTSVAVPDSNVCLGTTIELNLSGNSVGGLQTYKWQIGPSASGPWTDISAEQFNPGFSYVLNSVTNRFFRAAVKCGSTTVFSTPVEVVLSSGILPAGDYTIDPAAPPSATNFQSFTDAVAALSCGITGPVRFLAVPGTYTEQVRISIVPGSSAVNTVTFMSQNGDPASVILTFNSTSAASNYVLKLDSASHIIYKNITMSATNSSFGRVVELAGNAASDSILNCIIQAPVSASTSTNVVGIFSTGLTGGNHVIKGNTVTNGANGIYLSGMAGQSNHIEVDSNTVSGAYNYGIYAGSINSVKVRKNTVSRSGLLNTSAYGIYLTNCDSAYEASGNQVNITNTGTTIYGIYLTGCQASFAGRGTVSNNRVIATTGNTGNQYGIYVTGSTLNDTRNNVIVVNTSGVTSYGIYSTGTGGINYHNNSVQNSSSSTTNNIVAYFSQTSGANGAVNIRNNIFSHPGGGRAMYIANPQFIYSDYNMYYTTGATLIQWGTANNYATLQAWRDTSYWDFNSIVYQPAFTSGTDLTPNVASPDVWAIHGRGVQIPGNDSDFNNTARPVTLEEGVPDLGAYEFVPTSVPVSLTAVPATPLPNSTQTFMLGTDTVTKVTWGATVPATVTGKRYSGAVPPGLAPAQDYMYFYTDFDFTGTAPTGHAVKQYYLDPWRGFIASEPTIKLGRTDASNAWVVSTASTLDIFANTIAEGNLTVLDKYTGLTDGNAPPPPPVFIDPSDSSNRGKKFWVAYGHQYYFATNNSQNMVLYFGAAQTPANVTVRVNGTSWARSYTVPANSVITSEFMPKYGLFDARLLDEGWSNRGISIESDVPITAYAHIYSSASSGATMLMPVGTYGYEYQALTAKQAYSGESYSWFYVVAAYDSTVVEITPSNPTKNGLPANVPFTVNLMKGEVYQVMGAKTTTNQGYDMTGSRVKSIENANGKCYPVAVFSGSSRTALACDDQLPTLNGDNIIQQNFPYRAWGRRYLTAPTSASTNASTLHTNLYRVAVRDTSTIVKVNGVVQTNLINNLYYQFSTNTSSYIEADKPVMVAQYIPSTGECGNTGVYDPEMIYISPIEQGIRNVGLYRNIEENITVQYLTLIIPANGLSSLTIDGSNVFDHVYDHYLTGYKVVVKRWTAANAQTFVQSDSAFTAITYGLGSVESYGYNAGTLVLNLNLFPAISNVYNPSGTTNTYTCAGTPFRVSFLSTVEPTVIEWQFSQVPNISPNADVIDNSPTAADTIVINGITYYQYVLPQQYVINTPGSYNVPVYITHPDVEGCSNRMQSSIPIQVIGSPVADFNNLVQACINTAVQFNGIGTTANGVGIASWSWNFDDPNATPGNPNTATVQNPSHTYSALGAYDVSLSIIANEGCIADTVKPVQVTIGPDVVFSPDSLSACIGDNVTFNVQNPVAGAVYNWYTTPTGGSPVATGTSFTITNVTAPVSYYVEGVINGCVSATRTRVQVTVRPALTAPVVAVDSVGTNMVRFRWNAVAGATGYEVSINAGGTWTPPSSGPTGLTHTVTGLQINQTINILVRALGGCQVVVSQAVGATTITDQVFIPNAFTPNGDGLNDVLRIYSNVIRDLRFVVFNQWGEKIFESTSQNNAWDGTFKGKPQPSGVYMYVCDITLVDGRKIQRKGAINLVR